MKGLYELTGTANSMFQMSKSIISTNSKPYANEHQDLHKELSEGF